MDVTRKKKKIDSLKRGTNWKWMKKKKKEKDYVKVIDYMYLIGKCSIIMENCVIEHKSNSCFNSWIIIKWSVHNEYNFIVFVQKKKIVHFMKIAITKINGIGETRGKKNVDHLSSYQKATLKLKYLQPNVTSSFPLEWS